MSQFLTYEEVEHHVSCLPRTVLEQLAMGPTDELPRDSRDGDEPCRVCDVLPPFFRMRPANNVVGRHAEALWRWHEPQVEDLGEYLERADPDRELGDSFNLADRPAERAVFVAMMGAASYARCCLIYALAEKHLRIGRDA